MDLDDSEAGAHSAWVGAHLTGDDVKNDWQWITGEPLSEKYSKWGTVKWDTGDKKEPDVPAHKYAFIDVAYDDLRTWTGTEKLSFFCELYYWNLSN